MEPYYYKICPVCEAGRLFVHKSSNNAALYLLCEECFSLFDTPDESSSGKNAKEGIDSSGEEASLAEITAAGWNKWSFNK